MTAGRILLGAVDIPDPMHVGLRRYVISCQCPRIGDDSGETISSEVIHLRTTEMGPAFTKLIMEHKERIAMDGGRCKCEPDREEFQQLRNRFLT